MIKTYDLLKKYYFTIQKKYGQNFLLDQNILEGIADAAGITKEDIVLEIGPGLGALTQYLCERAGHVVAVEIDRMLIPILTETMQAYDNFTLVHQDILKTDIRELAADAWKKMNPSAPEDGYLQQRMKVVANLPYYITTPIVMELLEKQTLISGITVMVQKEVAERMQEGVGSKAYGALSLAVQYYAKAKIAMLVSKNCFVPKPDVDSAVIHLEIYAPEERPVKVQDEDLLFKIIRAAFNQRRKTLVNALANAAALPYSKSQIAQAITAVGKPETVRGEALTLEEFALLTEQLASMA